jgi:8-oxo-dGTP diphosphatase
MPPLCRAAGAQLLINGDAALAAELGVGLHLRTAQLMAAPNDGGLFEAWAAVREHGGMLAASCHSVAELQRAQELGVDFAVLSPVQATATHPDGAPLGWARFEVLRATSSLPVYALGGLSASDADEARKRGAQGVAAIRGLWPMSEDSAKIRNGKE